MARAEILGEIKATLGAVPGWLEDMPDDFFPDRPWGKGNNPQTAVWEFLKKNDRFEIDKSIENKLLITVAPDGYLKCVKD